MVTICQQCGDKGLSDALVYCYDCRVFAIHRYCLHVLPATFKELVIWYCEDCKSKAGKPSTVYTPMTLLPRTNDFRSSRTVKAAESVSRLKKKALSRLKNKLDKDISGSLSISEGHSGKISSCHYREVHYSENLGKNQKFRRHGELNGRSSDEEAESVKTKTSSTADCDNTSSPERSCELHYNESDNNNKKFKRHVGSDGSISDEDGESVKTKTSVVTGVLPDTLELGCRDHRHSSTDVPCSQIATKVERSVEATPKPKKFDKKRSWTDSQQGGSSKVAKRNQKPSWSESHWQSKGAKTSQSSVRSPGRSRSKQSWKTRPTCRKCGRAHTGECLKGRTGCYRCGQKGHYMKDCPSIVASSPSEARSAVPTEYQKQKGLVRGSSDEETESVILKTLQGAIRDPSNNHPKPISYIHADSIIKVPCNEKGEKDQRRIQRSLDRVSDEEGESVEAKNLLKSASKPSNISKRILRYIPAEPIAKPIWNGSLSLSNGTYGTVGLVAHLSSLACSKVVQEAKLLPLLLCLELLPRSNAWPKSFEKWGLSDDNIALYLFPYNEREEMVYDKLVDDLISQDLGMRTQVKNAELLVFPSKILPSQFWRIQAKFYLWGVFRGKQESYVPNAVIPSQVKPLTNNVSCYAKSPVNPLSSRGSYGSVYSQYFPSK